MTVIYIVILIRFLGLIYSALLMSPPPPANNALSASNLWTVKYLSDFFLFASMKHPKHSRSI